MNTKKKPDIIADVEGLYQSARQLLGQYGAPATSFQRLAPAIPADKLDRAATLVSLLVRDSIVYNKRLEEIHGRQSQITNIKREEQYTRMMSIGQQYIQLADSINNTMMPLYEEFNELVQPQPVSN